MNRNSSYPPKSNDISVKQPVDSRHKTTKSRFSRTWFSATLEGKPRLPHFDKGLCVSQAGKNIKYMVLSRLSFRRIEPVRVISSSGWFGSFSINKNGSLAIKTD